MKKLTIFFIIVDILVAACFFLFYGPYENFKRTIINTAMVTKTHQYIAYTFYDEATVKEIMSADAYIPIDEDMDLNAITIDTTPKDTYENEYDEQILTRDPGNEDYKYIKVKVGEYEAHLVAIYDPSRVKMITSKSFNTGTGAERIKDMCKRLGGKVCINGGRFKDPDGWGSDIPVGYLIKDGKVIWSDRTSKQELIGFTNDNKLLLIKATAEDAIEKGMRDALQFGPFLIVNGKSLQYVSTSGGYARAARTAIAQRRDGVVLFLVTEGTHGAGPNLKEVIALLEKYGAYNAASLDGGTSSQLVINNKLINTPVNVFGQAIKDGRRVVSGFGLF